MVTVLSLQRVEQKFEPAFSLSLKYIGRYV